MAALKEISVLQLPVELSDKKSHGFVSVELADDNHIVEMESVKPFSVTREDLRALIEREGKEALADMGGVVELSKKLEADPTDGIQEDPSEILRRKKYFGPNTHPEKPPRTLWFFIVETMRDGLLQILFLCGILSIVVSIPSEGIGEGFYDGSGIFLALVIIISVTAVSNYRQAQQFSLLSKESAKVDVEVVRGGRRQRVPSEDLVVGDVVQLSVGDRVPTDGIIITSQSLEVDESSMTGESELVPKDPISSPVMIAGCSVMKGYGSMLVTAVGMQTEFGRVLSMMTEENDEETPLQSRLTKVATLMGQTGLVVGVSLFFILSARYLATSVSFSNFTSTNVSAILGFFTVSVTVLVIAIPEGLPLAVALTLAFSVRKMMQDKSLVRHLAACETMGSATTICSDKTGTLTLNQMTVVQSWVAGVPVRSPGDLKLAVGPELVNVLFEGIAQNTTGSVYQPSEGIADVSGSPTERAVLEWGVKAGLKFGPQRSLTAILNVEVFSSATKRMGVVLSDVPGDNPGDLVPGCRVHWKGGAEIIVQSCSHWVDSSGEEHSIEDKRAEILAMVSNMAHSGLRCIALAYHRLPAGESGLVDSNLTCLAILGIKDPCRPEVPSAVRKCQLAGINVKMITGDSLETAVAIARECGILSPEGVTILGTDLVSLPPEEVLRVVPKIQVVARASPSDKLWLVQKLRGDFGEVVAVTGDGTNDAAALYEADIGLAMGICGTEVAKQSADIIILDDNFSSIVRTVTWGRSVHVNIQRFLQFQVTATVVAIGINLISALAVGSAPLSAVQMLWVDLIQDTFGALALASEPPSDALLQRAPVDRHVSLIEPAMWRNVVSQSVYQLGALLVLWFRGKALLGLEGGLGAPSANALLDEAKFGSVGDAQLVTIMFNTFVFCQIFNEINCRKITEWNVFDGLLRNHVFLGVLFVEIGCQVIMVNFLGHLTNTYPLTLHQWLLCVVIGACSVAWGIFFKVLPFPGGGRSYKKGLLRSVSGSRLIDGDDGGKFSRLEKVEK